MLEAFSIYQTSPAAVRRSDTRATLSTPTKLSSFYLTRVSDVNPQNKQIPDSLVRLPLSPESAAESV